jgi:sugar/nucleoside kinase (ribokinase family)
MAIDVLVLNTAVVDFRRADFDFADKLVDKGGLAKCKTEDLPDYSDEQLRKWIEEGFATAGGPGNTAPLIARTSLKVAVGVNLGKGDYDGLDAAGRFFYDIMATSGVDMSEVFVHPDLPSGITYIHNTDREERGGITYFPNANNDFDFEIFKGAVERLRPGIVYYMYSGLSDRADDNGGRDLAEFVKWCRSKEIVTIVDSCTLTGEPQELIDSGRSVEAYRLLEPLLPEVDLFFTSSDEAKMIENTLTAPRNWRRFSEDENNIHFTNFLSDRFWQDDGRTRLFGVTVSDGAYEKHSCPDGIVSGPNRIKSRFMAGEVIDLVGAGDSFRAGFITYVAGNLDEFRNGSMNFAEAVQMGNLFAALYIKAPLDDRYSGISTYDKMLKIVRSGTTYPTFNALQKAMG